MKKTKDTKTKGHYTYMEMEYPGKPSKTTRNLFGNGVTQNERLRNAVSMIKNDRKRESQAAADFWKNASPRSKVGINMKIYSKKR